MTKNQRIVVFFLLALVLTWMVYFTPTSANAAEPITGLIFSTLLLLSFTVLLAEPFFSRPTDVLAAGVSLLLTLVPARALLAPLGRWYWFLFFYALLAVLLATTALLLLNRDKGSHAWQNRASSFLNTLTSRGAPGKLQYFCLFLLTLVHFVPSQSNQFLSLALFSGFVVLVEPQWLGKALPTTLKRRSSSIGNVIGVQGPNTFLIKVYSSPAVEPVGVGDLVEFRYGMDDKGHIRRALVFDRHHLDNSLWLRAMCHPDIDTRSSDLPPLDSHEVGEVYVRSAEVASEFLDGVLGIVDAGTDIGTLRFQQIGPQKPTEGDLVQVPGNGAPVLYQVVNARVGFETLLERNQADSIVAEAIQLGRWDPARNAFDRYGWVPDARLPVTRARPAEVPIAAADDIELGRIPGTEFPVLLNRLDAVTHHTAILGVTGCGKSVFTRDLVRRLVQDETLRVIVVDFTQEWKAKLPSMAGLLIDAAASKGLWKSLDALAKEQAKYKDKQDDDVILKHKSDLNVGFRTALETFLKGDQRIGIFELPDVSHSEGVLEYTRYFFAVLFHLARNEGCFGRRVCVVLEEAHTVIPEWNFVGIADKGAQSVVNNISQIALQGRKYGIGFIVVAQRTATVSKTVLTQCNTIVAFQCFDGTSIEFLSHYMPRAVAEAIPNLRFRRAVAFGKALRGSVPLMFDVPEIADTDADPS